MPRPSNDPNKKIRKPIKYTPDFVLSELQSMLEYLHSDKGQGVFFIMELCLLRGYSHQRWSDNFRPLTTGNSEKAETIKELMNFIETTLEIRLAKAMLQNKTNVTASIFTLKNKYGWKEKTELSGDRDSPLLISEIVIKPRE